MKAVTRTVDAFLGIILALISVSYLFVREHLWAIAIIAPAYILVNLLPGIFDPDAEGTRLRLLKHGAVVVINMLFASVVSVAYHVYLAFALLPDGYKTLLWSAVYSVCFLALSLAGGIFFMYVTSAQLRVKWRVLGIVFGLIFPVNLLILGFMLEITLREVSFESMRIRRNAERSDREVCKTKYPVLLVHGFFFRDWPLFNYWGRIPKELEANGAAIYYGNHQSARPVPDSARELARRIRDIVEDTGCERVNVIAHSKGGVDMRYALQHLGIAPLVASLTTVSTPHRGCIFAERLLEKIPKDVQLKVASAYNGTLRLLGDDNPDFLAAARDLTASVCTERDSYPVPEGVYARSVGSHQKKAHYGRFPLNLSYHLVKYYDGLNDGMVALDSFEWGEEYTLVEPVGRRGISHGDMIDLNRENIKDFDVREFYVGLVSSLKDRGL